MATKSSFGSASEESLSSASCSSTVTSSFASASSVGSGVADSADGCDDADESDEFSLSLFTEDYDAVAALLPPHAVREAIITKDKHNAIVFFISSPHVIRF